MNENITIQKLIKVIKNLHTNNNEISELKEMALSLENKISSKRKEDYEKNIEASRLRRKLNNSKQAIKKLWKKRKEKSLRSIFSNKEVILKHIKIARETKEEINKLKSI